MALSHLREQVGRVLAGRYRLLAPLGAGASAQVYLAEDVRLRRRVAVKVLHPGLADDPTFQRRFQAEAQAAAALNHPNLLAVYDWGSDELPFLVTEYLDGGSLRSLLDEQQLSLSQTLLIGLEAARGLHYAHSRGFVHRDIKPANLLFGHDRRLRISDFGLARALAEAAWTEPEGVVLGTARYASPEQASGERVDSRSDVYSLAIVLVECVTGSVPHSQDTAVATLRVRAESPIEPPGSLGPLAPLVAAAGTVDPAARSSAAELGRGLMAVAGQLPPPTPLPLAPPQVEVDDTRTSITAVVPISGADAPPGEPGPNGAGRSAHQAAPNEPGPASAPTNGLDAAPGASTPPPAQPQPKPPRQRRKLRLRHVGRALLVALVIAAVATLAAIGVGLFGAGVTFYAVPPLVGQDVTAVEDQIAAGELPPFELEISRTRRADSRPDEVLAQEPADGVELPAGSVVRLTVSDGLPLVTVPADLVGMPLEEAQARLAAEQLAGEPAGEGAHHEEIAEGHVVEVVDAPTEVEQGTTLTLRLSLGPFPRQVPEVLGSTAAEAKASLEERQLGYVRAEEYSSSVPEGNVIWTNPAPGETVERGSNVTVAVSLGPEPVAVPDLIGMSPIEAVRQLDALGLGNSVSGSLNGVVVGTRPIRGTEVAPGSVVEVLTG